MESLQRGSRIVRPCVEVFLELYLRVKDVHKMNKSFNWIQLSDIHFNYKNFGTRKLRDELVSYIEKLRREQQFDVMLITGDIAFKGGKYQEELCSFIDKLLCSAGLDRGKLCMVPGNHDLERHDHRTYLINGILKSEEPCEKANTINARSFKDLVNDQKAYFAFHKKMFSEPYPQKELHYIKEFDCFNVVHINTCLLSGADKEEGALVIGQEKLYNVIQVLKESSEKFNIAIAHHTLDCLDDNEQRFMENTLIDCDVDILLCGHMHKPKYTFRADDYRAIPMFTCGAGIADKYVQACFITGKIDLALNSGSVTYHSWHQINQNWFIDNSIGRRTASGPLEFDLERFLQTEENTLFEMVDEDEFKQFIINFHKYIASGDKPNIPLVEKDVQDKFINMKCNEATKRQYDGHSTLFPIIEEIMESPHYMDFGDKITIIGMIVEEYNKWLYTSSNGTEVIDKMVDSIAQRYKTLVKLSEIKLKMYVRALVYWSIYGCDIFNDKKE